MQSLALRTRDSAEHPNYLLTTWLHDATRVKKFVKPKAKKATSKQKSKAFWKETIRLFEAIEYGTGNVSIHPMELQISWLYSNPAFRSITAPLHELLM
jgi:hypothetical protein